MPPAPSELTNEALAALLGVNVRTFRRNRVAGLPLPIAGETADAWVARAKAWKTANRRQPGPRTALTEAGKAADARWRNARAATAELNLAERKGELHSQEDCEEGQVARLHDMVAAFKMFPDRMARRVFQAPSPEAIRDALYAEIRRCFDVLVHGLTAAEDALAAEMDEPDAAATTNDDTPPRGAPDVPSAGVATTNEPKTPTDVGVTTPIENEGQTP